MTRIQAKDFLITSLGIEEPTSEMIDAYMNTLNGEVQKEKAKTEQYKKDADRVVELQKQLDDLNNANLSDIEKANKAKEDADKTIADLQKQIQTINTKNSLLANGIKDAEADKIIESLNSGNFDASIIGEIIADRQKTAVADFEKASLQKTPNPESGVGSEDEGKETKTEAENVASSYAQNFANSAKASSDIVSAYI